MKKLYKVVLYTALPVLFFFFVIPLLIPGKIDQEITQLINRHIDGKIQFKNSNISFFSEFPSLTINLNEVSLNGSAPFKQEKLLQANRISFGLNLLSLFSAEIQIDKIFLDQAKINVKVDQQGNANYNIYKTDPEQKTDTANTSAAIKIEAIQILNSELSYQDATIPLNLSAKNLNYHGKGDLSKDIFDLASQLSADQINLSYDGTPYLANKKLDAKLVTKVNTQSLELQFNENHLLINSLPISFIGKFAFLRDGYDLNFKTRAKETDLENLFTALPPAIAEEFGKTRIKGYAEINASLIGQYIVAQNLMPTATFNVKVRSGAIHNPKVPVPVTNLYLNLHTRLPDLNMDKLHIDLDSLYFNMGKDYVAAVLKLDGLQEAKIKTDIRTNIDLANWSGAFNLKELSLRGRLAMNFKANGQFTRKIVKSGIRQIDTVLATVPQFSLTSTLSKGYLKFTSLPAAVEQVNFQINAANTDGKYQNTIVSIKNLNLQSLNNYIRGDFELQTKPNYPLVLRLKAELDLADIQKVYPLEAIELNGKLAMDLNSQGPYNKAKKLFPITTASLKMDNGRIKTPAFPEALSAIQIDATLTNSDGTFRNSKLQIKPISFEMAGQPFRLKAAISNFDNIRYDLSSRGRIDIGKMYGFFAVKGYQMKGKIRSNIHFKGLQSDVMAGRYTNLSNKGSMDVRALHLRSDLFPKEFIVQTGQFSFTNQLMKFDAFKARYGASDFSLNGALENVIEYVLNDKAKLAGDFKLYSKSIHADEFTVYADQQTSTNNKAPTGVILIPEQLKINFQAHAGQVFYNGLKLKNAKGNLGLENGRLSLKDTGFELIDATVKLDASYQSKSLKSADFKMHLQAADFDIAKAYKEIKLFRDMASSASSVKGIVGLDYQLSGRLNEKMTPVLASIKGTGELRLKKVSLLGFKMLNAVSKETKRDSLKNPDLKDVVIKSSIERNIMTIERTKMRIAGFRPRFEGQISLDGKLNLSGRLGLPPFGLFGIPLSITGTQENPVVRMKRNKEGKLEESEEGDQN